VPHRDEVTPASKSCQSLAAGSHETSIQLVSLGGTVATVHPAARSRLCIDNRPSKLLVCRMTGHAAGGGSGTPPRPGRCRGQLLRAPPPSHGRVKSGTPWASRPHTPRPSTGHRRHILILTSPAQRGHGAPESLNAVFIVFKNQDDASQHNSAYLHGSCPALAGAAKGPATFGIATRLPKYSASDGGDLCRPPFRHASAAGQPCRPAAS